MSPRLYLSCVIIHITGFIITCSTASSAKHNWHQSKQRSASSPLQLMKKKFSLSPVMCWTELSFTLSSLFGLLLCIPVPMTSWHHAMSGVKCDNRPDQPPADTRDPWHHLASSSSQHRIKHEHTPPILAAISGMREHEVCTQLRALIVVYDKWTKRNVFSSNIAGMEYLVTRAWLLSPWHDGWFMTGLVPPDHPPHPGPSSAHFPAQGSWSQSQGSS